MSRRFPLIAAGVVVALLLGWYVAVWRPATSRSREAQASRIAAEGQQTKLEGQLAGLRSLQRTLPGQEAKLRQAEIEVPAEAGVDTVIDQINAVAIADHITWGSESQSLSTASPPAVATTTATTTANTTTASGSSATTVAAASSQSAAGDSILALSLSVAGNYQAMNKFITDLEHRPRLIVIDTLSYAPGAGGEVSAAITARAFYNPTANPTLPGTAGT